MKAFFIAAVLFVAATARAEDLVLKEINCEGATLKMSLQVIQEVDDGRSPALVSWNIEDSDLKASSSFMGYLFTEKDLHTFHSTDLGSDVDVAGSVAVVTFGDKEETLFCK